MNQTPKDFYFYNDNWTERNFGGGGFKQRFLCISQSKIRRKLKCLCCSQVSSFPAAVKLSRDELSVSGDKDFFVPLDYWSIFIIVVIVTSVQADSPETHFYLALSELKRLPDLKYTLQVFHR